ncbi:MAG: hypothetical protein NVS9B15_25520 [Acidobacteriaceae bacterium]
MAGQSMKEFYVHLWDLDCVKALEGVEGREEELIQAGMEQQKILAVIDRLVQENDRFRHALSTIEVQAAFSIKYPLRQTETIEGIFDVARRRRAP